MKRKDKKEQYIQHRGESGDVKEVIKNYDLEMRIVRKVPKTYYSSEGALKPTNR